MLLILRVVCCLCVIVYLIVDDSVVRVVVCGVFVFLFAVCWLLCFVCLLFVVYNGFNVCACVCGLPVLWLLFAACVACLFCLFCCCFMSCCVFCGRFVCFIVLFRLA